MSHIPNCTTSLEMARILVQYMSDAKRVRSELLTRFPSAPSVKSISALRGAWIMNKRAPKIAEHDTSQKVNDKMVAHGSDQLLRALWREHAPIMRHLNAQRAA